MIDGDIDVDKVEAKIKEIFSPIKMPENPAERKYFPVPDNKEAIVTIAKDKEQTNTIIYLWHKHDIVPNEAKKNMDYLVMNYMKSMINNMLNARLNELKETPQPPFIYAVTEDGNFFLSIPSSLLTAMPVKASFVLDRKKFPSSVTA